MSEMTIADLCALEAYTNNISNELTQMATNCNTDAKGLLNDKSAFFRRKNLTIQKRLYKVLESIPDGNAN